MKVSTSLHVKWNHSLINMAEAPLLDEFVFEHEEILKFFAQRLLINFRKALSAILFSILQFLLLRS